MDILSQLDDLGKPQVEQKEWMKSVTMILGTKDNLAQIEQECIDAKVFGLDLETSGLDGRAFLQDTGKYVTNDKIVGVCLAPNTSKGYYIPVRHKEGENVPPRIVMEMLKRIQDSGSVAVFHNAKFDLKFLQYEPSSPMCWDDINTWSDTYMMAYLRNPKERRKGLKYLAKVELEREMIELPELFHIDHIKAKKDLDFSMLNPSWEPVVWYAAADAINTLALYEILSPAILEKDKHGKSQRNVYKIEKVCLLGTLYMEHCRIHLDRDKIKELIVQGQKEFWGCIEDIYISVEEKLGRDPRPNWVKMFSDVFNPEDLSRDYMEVREECMRSCPKDVGVLNKSVPKVKDPREMESVQFPLVYDVLKPQELGLLFRETGVPGLKVTEKSGQVSTKKEDLDAVIKDAAEEFPFMEKIKRFREITKALGTNLFNIWKDSSEERSPGANVWANFAGLKLDTGRFSTPTPDTRKEYFGQVNWNVQSTPANYDKSKPECVWRMRECIAARPGHLLFAIDFSGVELRIVTNLSGEPKWMKEFFRCSSCEHEFDRNTKPPPFCPKCGSDKIGDLHSLTALSIYGEGIKGTKEFKLRRQTGKIVNFLLCYGGGGGAVMRSTGCDKEEGWRIKNKFDKSYRGLIKWWKKQHTEARKQLYVTTVYGRKYPLPDIISPEGGWRSKAERNAVNSPVQGTSADIMKLAMGLLYKEFKKQGWENKVLMNITIHDELVFEIPHALCEEAVELIEDIMCVRTVKNLGWGVPLKVDVEFGRNWSVPYNLTEMTWNQGGGDWTEEFIKIFPNMYKNYLKCGGKPVGEVPPELEKEKAPLIERVSPERLDTKDLCAKDSIEKPSITLSENGRYEYVVSPASMTPEGAKRLSRVITKCLGKGLDEMVIVDKNGNDLIGRPIKVAAEEFKVIAKYEGI